MAEPPPLPHLLTEIPGPNSRALAARLRAVESPGITCLDPGFWQPVFWERGEGIAILDADGNRFLDATAAFGVAALGHAHPRVAEAMCEQAQALPHAMGDVHPTRLKVELCERLAALSPLPGATRVLLASTGAEAVEGALKTARLASGRPGIVAFAGGYHGLTYGALAATHREHFRGHFQDQLREGLVFHAPYTRAGVEAIPAETLASTGAILVEPIQGRGGIVVPEEGFLADLRSLADRIGAALVFDEVFSGCGRTGRWFACEHEDVFPDLLVIGKALSNGFPISAVLGRDEVMRAWPESRGEAIHTSTHLGSPLGCRAALATLGALESEGALDNARLRGRSLLDALERLVEAHPTTLAAARGRGLMLGLQFHRAEDSLATVAAALQRGLFVLPAGSAGEVIELTPALVATEEQIQTIAAILGRSIRG